MVAYNDEFVVLSEGEEAHWEVCARILFIYGKLNPGQGYVQVIILIFTSHTCIMFSGFFRFQGMNEILGPIYFTFAKDSNIDFRRKLIMRLCILVIPVLSHFEIPQLGVLFTRS